MSLTPEFIEAVQDWHTRERCMALQSKELGASRLDNLAAMVANFPERVKNRHAPALRLLAAVIDFEGRLFA
jgi:hypothetical protein